MENNNSFQDKVVKWWRTKSYEEQHEYTAEHYAGKSSVMLDIRDVAYIYLMEVPDEVEEVAVSFFGQELGVNGNTIREVLEGVGYFDDTEDNAFHSLGICCVICGKPCKEEEVKSVRKSIPVEDKTFEERMSAIERKFDELSRRNRINSNL